MSPAVSLRDIIGAIEEVCPPCYQEKWDNTGWQVLPTADSAECTGALTCVDVTMDILSEAERLGCNLVIAHHPLIFNPVRSLRQGAGRVADCVIEACCRGIAVYAAHTSADSAPEGINTRLADLLELTDRKTLHAVEGHPEAGMGIVGTLPHPVSAEELVGLVKKAVATDRVRISTPLPGDAISRIGLCGGAGFDFMAAARQDGATAYISSDIRHHEFVDCPRDIFLIDITHHDAEKCAKDIFNSIIRKKFPTFAVHNSSSEINPITFL